VAVRDVLAEMVFSATGLGLGLVPFEGGDHEREPILAGEQADGDLRLQTPFLGESRLAEPVALVRLEIQCAEVVKDQAETVGSGRLSSPSGAIICRCPKELKRPAIPS
jgi:hypothetical protein